MITKFEDLTTDQKDIVTLSEGQHLILAPPGTGKTELLAHRVEKALSNGIPVEKMICLTFTNRAAKGMKERIEERYPHNRVFISNIHQFCSAFLYKNKLISQYISLMDEEDSALLLEEAKSALNYQQKDYIGDFLKLNSYLRMKEFGFPDEVMILPPNGLEKNLQSVNVCKKYEELKRESFLFDFDDLLINAFAHLSEIPANCCLTKFKWIQVDEVQDLNPIQWGIISKISDTKSHNVYFGDYEQAIFSFMGARLENLHKIRKECDKVHNLQKNFRSPSYLINVQIDYAKALLNPAWKKDPIPERSVTPQKDDLQLVDVKGTNKSEANFVINGIIPQVSNNDDGQIAIIVKWNSTADIYSDLLTQCNIDHFKISGYDLFNRKLIKDIIAFLSCLENEYDRGSWFRLFNIFGKIPTLRESRHFVNGLYSRAFFPADFIYDQPFGKTELQSLIEDCREKRLVIFDTETTGLNTEKDDIIQIAAIEILNGRIGRTFEVYLQTEKSLDESQNVHHITKQVLDSKGVPRKKGLESFLSFVNNDILVAHNLKFDIAITKNNLIREELQCPLNNNNSYDTLRLARRLYPEHKSFKLEDLLIELKIEGENSHNALDDVKATANLLQRLNEKAKELETAQSDFIQKGERTLSKFRSAIEPLWSSLLSHSGKEQSLPEVIYQFLDYAKENLSYDIDQTDLHQLNKLLNHMQSRGKLPLLDLLAENIPDYRHYKEADLITGKEKIIISTVYKAKGLEFQTVIVPECVDSVYPSFSCISQEQRTEDARALYVAISRARKKLILTTHSISQNRFGKCFPRERSPFLSCIEKHFKSLKV